MSLSSSSSPWLPDGGACDIDTWRPADLGHCSLFTAQNWYNLVFRLVIVLDCNTITPDNHRKIGQDVSSLELELKSRGSHI